MKNSQTFEPCHDLSLNYHFCSKKNISRNIVYDTFNLPLYGQPNTLFSCSAEYKKSNVKLKRTWISDSKAFQVSASQIAFFSDLNFSILPFLIRFSLRIFFCTHTQKPIEIDAHGKYLSSPFTNLQRIFISRHWRERQCKKKKIRFVSTVWNIF